MLKNQQMNYRILLLTLIIFVFASSCEKTEPESQSNTFKVKILSEICNTAIVQILDSNYYHLGVSGYTSTGIKFDHVFNTKFTCEDMQKMQTLTASRAGLVVSIKTVKEPKLEPGCVLCEALTSFQGAPFIPIELLRNWSN
ncbi:MAG: hypothetical protein EAZ35_10885 [Sphingobacteriia bacterium]|nr:MAG: hypothetical protein EAZ41_04910 [Sphingobacteriia bacterium]TAG29404.1 MAG: hypothetical protein EAZ35_10885 [Sphingobacteriia bacterium]